MSTTPPHLISCQSTDSDASEPVELAYTPTWSGHWSDPANNPMGQPDSNVYLQLSQVLEWEIWTHSQTRAKLISECMRSAELVAQVNRLSNELALLRKLCQTPRSEKKESSATLYSNPRQERKTPEPWNFQPSQLENGSDVTAGTRINGGWGYSRGRDV